jgi:pimeloyl-ACP methyl ester carboxylesterase
LGESYRHLASGRLRAVAPPLFVTEHPPRSGDGPLVVMVHGSMDRHASFVRVRRALPEARVVLYDRRGYGRSRDVAAAASLDDHADDLLGVAAGRPTVVLGHSYGGCVALRAAELEPTVVRGLVVYEAPTPWLSGWPTDTGGGLALAAPDPAAAAEAFLRRILGDERWEALSEHAKADRRAEGAALVSDMRTIRPATPGGLPVDLSRVRQPVIVGRGSRSMPHHVAGMERLAGILDDAELVTLEGATHGAHAAQPEAMADLVRRVIERCG